MSHWYFIDDIRVIESSEQEVATTPNLLVTHTYIRGWEMNSTKIQGPSPSMKFLGVQWYKTCKDISSKVKDKVMAPGLPFHQVEAQYLVGLFRV